MGILNATPDSFFPGSRVPDLRSAINTARNMISQGADILDIGGESTRPGSETVDADEQKKRIVPIIREIRAISSIDISVDTRMASVAEAALDAGATIINDISSLSFDRSMRALAAERAVPVILMHMQGEPLTMQENPEYRDVLAEVLDTLKKAVDQALDAGIRSENIVLDPGIGFGKRLEDNLILLRNLGKFRDEGFPVLVGLSRKSFLGAITGSKQPEDRLIATVAAHAYCLTQGVDYLRVHDVKETAELLTVWEALAWGS